MSDTNGPRSTHALTKEERATAQRVGRQAANLPGTEATAAIKRAACLLPGRRDDHAWHSSFFSTAWQKRQARIRERAQNGGAA